MQEIAKVKPLSIFPKINLLSRPTQWSLDCLVLIAAFVLAYLLRFDFKIPESEFKHLLHQLPYIVLMQLALLVWMNVHSFVWRYTGMAEMKVFVKTALLSCVPILAIRLGLGAEYRPWQVPVSIIFMDMVIAFGAVLGLRVTRRVVYEWSEKKKSSHPHVHRDAVLLIGAGRAGVMTAREIQGNDMGLHIVGFIDEDPGKVGSVIQGIKVLGTTSDLARLVKERKIDYVIISIAKATRHDFRRILGICEEIPIRVRVIPGFHEIIQGKVKVSRIRDVQIEDLLGREPVQLDEEEMGTFLAGKTIMVTGAGGSIGSELARQVARFQPSALLLVERAEFGLFEIDRELRKSCPDLRTVPLIADISDQLRMHSIFARYLPQVVFHAAAHKQVPLTEHNVGEAVKNNVLATQKLGRLAGEFGCEAFVLISTDKAVRPTSVMGATKRLAELVMQYLSHKWTTRYVAVRFGNVIGSTGSVIPIFREQIRNGGPVTVTHPEMLRYFMTIPEAAQLVLQAGAMAEGGEIFILDMGEPVRILDLAKEAIRLSGLKPFEDIDIVFTGVRPGEKLFEELEMTQERVVKTWHPKIFIGKIAQYPETRISYALNRLDSLSKDGDEADIRKFINELIPEAQIRIKGMEEVALGARVVAMPQGRLGTARMQKQA